VYQGYYGFVAQWASQHVEAALFYLLAFIALPLAYGVIFDPRIIRCGFLLIGVFGAISGIFFLLQAQFLALAQLMIYAVGITLVVVIALMLTNPRMEHDVSPVVAENRLPAVLTAISLFVVIYLALRAETWQVRNNIPMVAPTENVVRIGQWLLGYYSLPFEFASVLLLVALVGAVMLAKADAPDVPEQLLDTEDALEAEENVVKV
jgi:NADH:ubiquinone oxidoreductase subunit 6 (subunit J)